MNKQHLAILSIIALGSLVSIAYATSTVISDAGITTPTLNATNINVSGTCTGCGAGIKTYNATVTNSQTINTVVLGPIICNTLGGIMFEDSGNLYDGVVAVQVQKNDTTWATDKGGLGGSTFYIVSNNYFGSGTGVIGQTSGEKIPLNLRVIVTSQATVGSYTIQLRCA